MLRRIKEGFGANSAKKKEEQRQKDRDRYYKSHESQVFENNVRYTELGKMTVGIAVYQGPGVAPLSYEIAFARFLVPGKENAASVATSYSYELFKSVIQEKINEIITGRPLDMEYGTFEYIKRDGMDQRPVYDQVSFEVAINHLFHKRDESEILPFTFKAETEQAERTRLQINIPKAEFDIADAGSGLQGVGDAVEAQSGSPKGLGLDLDRHLSDNPLSLTSLQLDSFATRVTSDPNQRRPLSSQSTAAPSVPTSPRSPRSPVKTKSNEDRPKSKLSETLSEVGSKIKKKVTGKETPAERRERFKSLWEEDERTVFKKGGEDEVEDDNISAIAAIEKDDDEDGVEVEEDDDDISQEDRAITKLQGLLSLPELAQLQDPGHPEDPLFRWNECCGLFGIDPEKTGIEELVTIAGLKTQIYQYQAFGIYWQMITSRQVGGGFVTDDMGLGKTLSFIAYMVVERQLSCLWQQVDRSRQLKNGQHLPEDEKSAAPCPSGAKAGWISCPCSHLNLTSRLRPKSGLRLACVPSALVRSWWEQWKTHVDTGVAELALNIIVDHKGAFDNNTSSEDLLSKSDSGRSRTRPTAERYKGRGGQGDDTAKPYQDGWLVLTTKENFPNWVKNFQYDGMVKADGAGSWKKGKRVNLVFGIAMIDECHEDLSRNTGRNKILSDLPPANSPFVWGYSGTPISQSPRGLEGVLWAIERHTQSHGAKHPNYPRFSWTTLNKISIDFNNQKDSKTTSTDGIDKVLEEFKPFLRTFVLRRDQNTKWFGHPLIKLKPHIHQDIILKQRNPLFTPQEIEAFEASYQAEKDELLAKLQEKFDNEPEARRSNTRPTELAFNTWCAKSWRSSLLATFPFLLNVATAGPDTQMSLTDQEALFLRGSDTKEKDNGYFRNLASITEHSPKALWLYEFIHNLEGKKDVNGEEEKLLIITQFPQVAFILKLFIRAYFPDKKDRVGLVTGRMTLKEKSETINAFTGKEKTASKRDVQILIGTTRLLGVGLQLTRASNIVLMEPDHHFVRELQGYARVHRIGQRNPVSYSWRLVDGASAVEGRVLRRQADRREFPGRRVGVQELGREEEDAGLEGI